MHANFETSGFSWHFMASSFLPPLSEYLSFFLLPSFHPSHYSKQTNGWTVEYPDLQEQEKQWSDEIKEWQCMTALSRAWEKVGERKEEKWRKRDWNRMEQKSINYCAMYIVYTVNLYNCLLMQTSNQPNTWHKLNAFSHGDLVRRNCWGSNWTLEWKRKVI